MGFTTFQPKDDEVMLLREFDAYIDSESLPAFYTMAEKPLMFSPEFAEYLEGIPRILVRKDIVRFGMGMSVTAMEWTPEIMLLARGGYGVDSDPNYRYVHWGTNYIEPSTHRFRFVTELVNGKTLELVLLKAKSTDFPEATTGTGEYANIPFTLEALRDSTESDTRKDLGYMRWER